MTESAAGERPAFLHSFSFLLAFTIACGLIAELAYLGVHVPWLARRLPALLVVPLPPFIAGALLPYLIIRLVYRSSLKGFGIRWIDHERPVLPWLLGSGAVALVIWLGLWGMICGAVALLAKANIPGLLRLADLHTKNPLYSLIHGKPDAYNLALVIHMTLLVGFAEELFGRGLLQNALDSRYSGSIGSGRFSIRKSTVLAALLFAFWHTRYLNLEHFGLLPAKDILLSALVALTIVLVPSLLLCVVYEKTRSLLAVIILHNIVDGGKIVAWFLWSLVLPG